MNELESQVRNQVAHPETHTNVGRNELESDAQRRWESEAAFFDRLADSLGDGPLPPEVLARYLEHPRRIYEKEFRFRLLGDLHGQRVLDVGCGEGTNAVLLAKLGAEVEGVDVSSRLVEIGTRRAQHCGVADRVKLHCAPIEKVSFPVDHFDVIWGDGVLHHLIDVLEPTLEQLARWAKPNALFLFSEPVVRSPLLRRLRGHLPIHTDATPDERPLEENELAILRRLLPDLRERHFQLLGRLTRFVVPLHGYERAHPVRRRAADLVNLLDYVALGFPQLQALSGTTVMWARLDK